ncbi:MAG TPA: hypothetical protein VKJ00_03240 [Thermoanaerobaculia bacterium]|nr:hypothetical protein [Thermoanaerobaculia bacterium]
MTSPGDAARHNLYIVFHCLLTIASSGLPMVEVPSLTINSGARVLYAATHGRSAWELSLP